METIDDIKANHPLSSIVGQAVKLKRHGRELKGCCPFHHDKTPSFYVSDELGRYYCHGCGATGDVIQFAMDYNNVSFSEAKAMLRGAVSFGNCVPPRVTKVPIVDRNGLYAKEIWEAAGPITGTPAETYLLRRGIDLARLPTLPALRFGRLSYPGRPGKHAAQIAGVSSPAGEVVSIQRIYVTEDGRKLDVPNPKLSLGPRPGGAIRLGEGTTDLIICEGLEDGLSILGDMPDQVVWVAAGASMIDSIVLPEDCRTVVIARDNDRAGEIAAESAKNAFLSTGRTVHVMSPPAEFKDFNQMVSERNAK
jgi:DNA primase